MKRLLPTDKTYSRRLLLCLAFSWVLVSCDDAQQVSNSGRGAFGVDIAVSDSALPAAIAWYDTRHESADIYLRYLDEHLRPASQEIRLTKGYAQAYEPDIVIVEEHAALVWYEEEVANSQGQEGRGRVYFGLYDRRGAEMYRVALSDGAVDARIPVIAATQDSFFVAWLQAGDTSGSGSERRQIMGTWLDLQGATRLPAHAVSPASSSTWNLNLSIADAEANEVVLVFDAEFETAASELYAVHVTPHYSQMNRLTADDGYASKYPDVALSPNGESPQAALTWYDELYGNNEIYLLQLPASALFVSDVQNFLELQATRVTESEGDSIGAYLAWQRNRLALVWSERISGRYEIFYQLWSQNGDALSAALRLTNSRDDSYIPSIVASGERFALAWSEVSLVGPLRDAQLSRAEIAVQYIE